MGTAAVVAALLGQLAGLVLLKLLLFGQCVLLLALFQLLLLGVLLG